MKHVSKYKTLIQWLIPFSFLAFSVSAFAQSGPVTKNPNTNEIREDLKIGSGRTLSIVNGGALILDGKTVSAFAYTLLDDTSAAAMRTTLGLGSAATTASTAYATSAQGALATSAVQPTRTLSVSGLLTGGGDLYANRTFTVTAASNGEATTGTATNRAMTPASTRAAIDGRPKYALFNIPLGGGWVDFELKGTLSNFGEHTPFTDLYLYYHSSDPARTTITSQTGPLPAVWFTDSGYIDHRRWRKQTATQSVWQMRSRATAIIAAVIAAVPVDATVSPTNANLVWSYCRMSATDYERDSTGSTIWYPIFPTWSTVLPTP